MTTDNKKTIFKMSEDGSKLEELSDSPFNAKGELNSKSLQEAMAAITRLAEEFENRDVAQSFMKSLDAIAIKDAMTTITKSAAELDPTKLETFEEWKHLESHQRDHIFWNNPSNYQVNFIFKKKNARRQLKAYREKAASYLKKYSALFSSFGREDAKMRTDLFDMKCFVSGDKRVVEFSPKKMKVFHTTIWGADILSDVEIDTTNQAIMRQLVDIKVQIDRWNMVTGFFIISEGIASAYPMIEYQKEFQARMKETGARERDRVSAPFILEESK